MRGRWIELEQNEHQFTLAKDVLTGSLISSSSKQENPAPVEPGMHQPH
jgi:hypothetical protein